MIEHDPLSQLRDIHLPEPGSFWPPAPGWWLLAALLVVAVGFLAAWLIRKYRRNRWLKAAHAELGQLQRNNTYDNVWFGQLNRLLKRCARICYPGSQPQNLSGSAWVEFLLHTGGDQTPLSASVIEAMVAASWQPEPDCDPAQALAQARQWLQRQQC